MSADEPVSVRASRAVAEGRHDDAIQLLDAALLDDPDDEVAICTKSLVLRNIGRVDEARVLVQEALTKSPDAVTLLYESGMIEISAGNVESAMAAFDRAVALDPSHVETLAAKSFVLRNTGKSVDAGKLLDAAMKEQPESVPLLVERGWVHFSGNDFVGAARCFDHAFRIDPASEKVIESKCTLARTLCRFADERDLLDIALQLHPKNSSYLLARGMVAINLNRLDEADDYFNEILEGEPDSEDALHGLGLVFQVKEDPDAARECFDRGLATHPASWKLLVARGWVANTLKLHAEAVGYFDRVLNADPSNMLALQGKVAALRENGQGEQVGTVIDAAIEALTEVGFLYAIRADLRIHEGDKEGATADLERAIELDPVNTVATVALSQVLRRQGRYKAAAELIEGTLARIPHHAQLVLEAGWVALDRSLAPQAARLFDDVLETNPFDLAAMVGRARALVAQCRVRDAVRVLEEAQAINPKDVTIVAELALSDLRLRRPSEALARVERALKIDSSDPSMLAMKATALRACGRGAEAEAVVNAALESAPNSARLISERGWCRMLRDALDEAAADFLEAAEIERRTGADEWSTPWRAGIGLAAAAHHQDAVDAYRATIEIDSDAIYARHNLSYLLWTLGNYEQGHIEWDHAEVVYMERLSRAEQSGIAEHFTYYGWMLLEVRRDLARAEEMLLKAQSIDPDDEVSLAILISVYRAMGREYVASEEATLGRRVFKRHDRSGPGGGSAETPTLHPVFRARQAFTRYRRSLAARSSEGMPAEDLVQQAGVFIEMEEYDEARKLLERAHALEPNSLTDAEALNGLGVVDLRTGDLATAVRYFKRALVRNPLGISIRVNVAEAYLKLKQTEDAEREYKELINYAPRSVEARIGLGEVYTEMGDTDDDYYELAIRSFTEALGIAHSSTGSKSLTDTEEAAVRYSRGYARVASYEAASLPTGLGLGKALKDFKTCKRLDPTHHKAIRAIAKIQRRRGFRSPDWIGERLGPVLVSLLALAILVVVHWSVIWGEPLEGIGVGQYSALTGGAMLFLVAGLYLPRLQSLRLGGLGLEKSVVDQVSASAGLGIHR